jgi:6-pyruvoyltetrahydropterin/6-carboxytetrahydropterin synthase
MFRVSRELDFSYGHRLLNYPGKCRHLHGHNGKVIVTIEAARLDDRGMVFDFADIKRKLSGWIDEHLDHRMILHRDDPAVPVLKKLCEPLVLLSVNPTAENLARLIADYALGQGFPVANVRLWETPRCCAAFCPDESHCARIELVEVNAEYWNRSVGPLKEDAT